MPRQQRSWTEWTQWAFVLACAPLALLLIQCLRSAYRDVQMVRTVALRGEINQLRSQSVRRAEGLEILIDMHNVAEQPWSSLREQSWLATYWSNISPEPTRRSYAAVVDESGTIVMHTDPQRVGQHLGRGWYESRVPEAGVDVFRLEGGPLSGDASAFDVAIPLTIGGRWIGEYHEGLDARRFDQNVAGQQWEVLSRWIWMLAVALTVDAGAIAALVYLARRQRGLWWSLKQKAHERARELAQLGGGLAHEVRNPLHALRINLHTLRRALGGRTPLTDDQLVATLDDSDAAIDRIEGLMRDLLQFADPAGGEVTELDVRREVRATLNLLAEDLRRDQVEVRSQFCRESTVVAFDPTRLRQVLLNLLTFAQHQAGTRGTIEVEVARRNAGVEVVVSHSGPALAAEPEAHLFEPFQAPSATGSGLGLALVPVHVEAAGGEVTLERSPPVGHRFRLWLPVANSMSNGERP